MGDPEIEAWDDNQDYISSSNRNQSKSAGINRSPKPRSRSRYFNIRNIGKGFSLMWDVTGEGTGSPRNLLQASRNLPFLLLLTGHRRYIQGEIEVKVQMKENFLQLMNHEKNGEKQIGGKVKRGLDQNLQMMQENHTNLN